MQSLRITDDSEINDIRTSVQLRGFSFSNFKKTEVRAQMLDNMKRGKVEPACYWCAELVCAGHYLDVWETILYFLCKHIHLGNPKMAVYVNMRYGVFCNIMAQSRMFFTNELQIRNHDSIRKMFAELVCNLTLSDKKPSFESVKLKKTEDFILDQLAEKLKAPSVAFAHHLFHTKDPKEMLIAINEFAYSISPEGKNMSSACYWIEWVIEFEHLCKTRSTPTKCFPRQYNVETKYKADLIWLVWDAFMDACQKREEFIVTVMDALLDLFCMKYTTACSKKRRYLLYFAVELLTEPITTMGNIVANKDVLQNVTLQINNVYKQIKKNEQRPNVDYMYSGLDIENNFKNTVQKMEMLQSMSFT